MFYSIYDVLILILNQIHVIIMLQFYIKKYDLGILDIHICHTIIMFHPSKYLKYWICTYIIHISHCMKFVQILYKLMKN